MKKHPSKIRKEGTRRKDPRDNTQKNVTTQTRATKDNNGDLLKGSKLVGPFWDLEWR